MTQEQYEVLTQIFSALQVIETKGQNTIIMGDVLRALQQLINSVNMDNQIAADAETAEEI